MTSPESPPRRTAETEPPAGTVERWAFDYVRSRDLAHKTAPPPPPDAWAHPRPAALRLRAPGRPPELRVVPRTARSLRRHELRSVKKRAAQIHTFWHHELQAAELMCWAVLAFPDAEEGFRRGLLRIAGDELRHMGLYAGHLARLGFAVGDFPVRDWFWQRVPQCRDPLQFVALLGLGLEGGNLDHSQRYDAWFEEVGDHDAAAIQRVVCRDEIGHVAFAARWFAEWTGGAVDFERWCRELVPPLTPALLRGRPLNRSARLDAGLPPEFVDALAAFADPLR